MGRPDRGWRPQRWTPTGRWSSGAAGFATVFIALGADATAQRPARTGPEIVAPGTISTERPEFAVTFTPDGREVYFNRASADRDTLVIMVARRDGDGWTTPTVAAFSGRYRDIDPFVTPDGRRLFFSSNRPRPGETGASFNTWYLERREGRWSDPIDPGAPLNTDSTEIFVSVATDGTIAFTSNRDGPSRIYLARSHGSSWEPPEPVTFGTDQAGGNPLLRPDGQAMFLVRQGPDDRADIHLACRGRTGWDAPIRLPEINSRWADFAPALDPSGTHLYFTSERPGIVAALAPGVRPPGDIYRTRLDQLTASCPTR